MDKQNVVYRCTKLSGHTWARSTGTMPRRGRALSTSYYVKTASVKDRVLSDSIHTTRAERGTPQIEQSGGP